MSTWNLADRARAYAALGDPSRLAIIDLLAHADLASGELGGQLGIPTNLTTHHLRVLEEAGLIERRRSEGTAAAVTSPAPRSATGCSAPVTFPDPARSLCVLPELRPLTAGRVLLANH